MARGTRLLSSVVLIAALALCADAVRAGSEAEQPAPSPAEQALRLVAGRYAAMETFQGRFVLTQIIITDEGTERATLSIVLALNKPEQVYVRLGPEGGQLVLVSDGERLWTYSPSTGKYLEEEAPGDLSALFRRPPISQIVHGDLKRMTFGLFTAQPYQALIEGIVSMEHVGVEDGAARVSLVGEDTTTEVWIDAQTGALLRAVFHPTRMLAELKARSPGLQDVRMELEYEPLDGEQGLEELLAFRPPDGAIRAESFRDLLTVLLVGKPMIDFELQAMWQDAPWRLSEQKGKVIALDFFATWCGPCRAELPRLVEIYQDLKDEGFLLLAVNVRETPRQVAAFWEEMGLEVVPIALDSDGQVAESYGVEGIPKLILIGRDGVIAAVHEGYKPGVEKQIRSQVEKLLAGEPLAEEE